MYDQFSLLEKIRNDPQAYLGSASLTCFFSFENGHGWALRELRAPLQLLAMRESFHHWVTKKLFGIDYVEDPCERLAPWTRGESVDIDVVGMVHYHEKRFITLVCPSDEQAFHYYCTLMDEWKRESLLPEAESVPLPHHPLPIQGLRDLLEFTKNNTFMHGSSITRLRAYVDGYLLAYREQEATPPSNIDFDGFSQWLMRHFPGKGNYRWERALQFAMTAKSRLTSSFISCCPSF